MLTKIQRRFMHGKKTIYFDIDGNWSYVPSKDLNIPVYIPEELTDEDISALVNELIYDNSNIIGGIR